MKYILITLLLSSQAFADDIVLNVKSDKAYKIGASAQFLASSDSFFCRELSMNDGSPRRIPKRRIKEFEASQSTLVIPFEIKSKCQYQRVSGASLNLSIPGKAQAYNTVSVFYGGGDLAEQIVNCREILSGPRGDQPMIYCSGDIQTTDDGRANLIIQ